MLLARWFLARFAAEFSRRLRGFDAGAAEAIAAHRWPGNVRELENRVRRAVLMADGQTVTADDLELAAPDQPEGPSFDLRAARLRAEREAIERALAHAGGSLASAARLLGIARPTLYGLLNAHGLMPSRMAADPALRAEAEQAGLTETDR
jgi:two-component system NtrC family response regulator